MDSTVALFLGITLIGDLTNDFKKDKYKDQIEEFERRVKEEEALRRKYELKENDLIIMGQKGNIIDIREWRNDPLKRVVTIRYRQVFSSKSNASH